MLKVLFICSQNRMRSPTAEQLFARHPGVECASAGLNRWADNPLSDALLEWADMIFVMEQAHVSQLSAHYAPYLGGKRVVCLDIPDIYPYMDPGLIELLQTKVRPLLPPADAAR